MPAANPPPQTLKQAKRAYQKSSKGFTFTASQERAAARRNAKDEYARKLREKEDRAKNNKRKRDEKGEKERQAKKMLIEKGQLSESALLPKVRSSQPRLSAFLRHPSKPVSEPVPPLPQREEDDETVKVDSEVDEDTLVSDRQLDMPAPPKMDENELEEFFLTTPSSKDELGAKRDSPASQAVAEQPAVRQNTEDNLGAHTRHDQANIDAQLGYPLSQALLEFDICEDPLSDSEQVPVITPSPHKRKRVSDEYATPSKVGRSALSEMSPGKVFLRSQEKPDTTSAPSIAARMLSPEHQHPSSSQLVKDTLAMISTQDISDDIDSSPAKENADPMNLASSQRCCSRGGSRHKSTCEAMADRGQPTAKLDCAGSDGQDYFDDLVDAADLDELIEDNGEADEFENGISDSEWVGLSTQLPKNTAVSAFGSPKKARAARTPNKMMAPPPRPSPVANLVTKLKEATPKKPASVLTLDEQEPSSANQSLDFDDGISDADLAGLSTQMPKNGVVATARSAKTGHNASPTPVTNLKAPSLGLSLRYEPNPMRTVLTPKKAQAPASPIQQEAPPASQSFGLNDGMDDDMLALVEEVDCAGSSSMTNGRKGRVLPWQTRPANWNAMMADDEQSEAPEGQRNARFSWQSATHAGITILFLC